MTGRETNARRRDGCVVLCSTLWFVAVWCCFSWAVAVQKIASLPVPGTLSTFVQLRERERERERECVCEREVVGRLLSLYRREMR